MGKLTDILAQSDGGDIRSSWDETVAAEDYDPVPAGEYVARLVSGELESSRTNATPGYKLIFRILEGEFKDRQLWHDVWLTPASLPMAKRDLGKIGVENLDQLERPLPPGIRCKLKVALRREDDGTERNRVRRFDVIGVDEPERDPFAPTDSDAEGVTTEPEASAGGADDDLTEDG